jgi:predicted nucleic acid-binding protein
VILVDTNVISEAMRPLPDRNVVAWLDEQLAETLYVSAVSLSELLLGIALLPDGARKLQIDRAFREQEGTLFGNRILPFGEREARAYASVVSRARLAGHAISVSDGQIAATAVAAGLVIATRDRAPFEAAGLRVLDPWAS